MSGKTHVSRRDFIKTGAAGLALSAVGVREAKAAASSWSTGMAVNSAIPNLRVVSCRDPLMVNQDAPILGFGTMSTQNNAANKTPIQNNLDEMAKALAMVGTANAAWQAIFRLPAGRTWAQAKIAIKVNALGSNHPRVAIIDKVCRVLNGFGAAYSNMTIFDAGRNCTSLYSSFVGNSLPAGVVVSDGGSTVTIPSASGNITCTNIIASAGPTYTADIIVNISVNKGHNQTQNGLVTGSMKNNLGTVNINTCPNLDMLFAMSTCDAILGGTPPRQQICIVDSLWANISGPDGEPPYIPTSDANQDQSRGNVYRLIMGTFSPAVDYLMVKKVREVAPMLASHNTAVTEQFLIRFGYSTTDRDNLLTLTPAQNSNQGWVEVSPASVATQPQRAVAREGRGLTVALAGRGSVRFMLPESSRGAQVSIMDMTGRQVRSIDASLMSSVVWDGRSDSGAPVAAGQYVVRAVQGQFQEARTLTVGM